MLHESKTTDFAPRKVESGCCLGHIAVNRIFDTFDVSGTPDKNRVLDVVNDLIDHVQAEAAPRISGRKAYEALTGRKHGER